MTEKLLAILWGVTGLLLVGGMLGYLPSPISSKLDAHDRKNDSLLAVSQVACGYLAKLAKESETRCYKTLPGYVSVETR